VHHRPVCFTEIVGTVHGGVFKLTLNTRAQAEQLLYILGAH